MKKKRKILVSPSYHPPPFWSLRLTPVFSWVVVQAFLVCAQKINFRSLGYGGWLEIVARLWSWERGLRIPLFESWGLNILSSFEPCASSLFSTVSCIPPYSERLRSYRVSSLPSAGSSPVNAWTLAPSTPPSQLSLFLPQSVFTVFVKPPLRLFPLILFIHVHMYVYL